MFFLVKQNLSPLVKYIRETTEIYHQVFPWKDVLRVSGGFHGEHPSRIEISITLRYGFGWRCVSRWVFFYMSTAFFWSSFLLDLFWVTASAWVSTYCFFYFYFFNPIWNGPFRGCTRMEGAKKVPVLKICHTYPTTLKYGTDIPYLQKIKKYINHVMRLLNSANISIFLPEISNFCYIKKYRYRLQFKYIISCSINFYWVFKDLFNKHGCHLDDVSKIDHSRSS